MKELIMNFMSWRLRATLLLILCSTTPVWGQIKLHPLFSDNMVLQHGMPTPVWGTAPPDENITVTFSNQTETTTADPKGHWQIKLKSLTAGGPFTLTVAGGPDKITLSNVLVGEVWFCSGQSNMVLPLSATSDAKNEIPKADYPQLRFYTEVEAPNDGWPLLDTNAQWNVCTPKTAAGFSAAAYYFGRNLQKALHVPIGLIHASVGGSRVQCWTDMNTLQSEPDAKAILDRWSHDTINYPAQFASYLAAKTKWDQIVAAGKTAGNPPHRPVGPGFTLEPAGLYDKFIAYTIPYAIRGVIWYQGESDRQYGYLYRKLFPEMITDWRKNWGEDDFPFIYVQLPS